MTHIRFRDGKSWRSKSTTNKVSCAILASISILSVSLGVTTVQSATNTDATNGVSVREFNPKIAETQANTGPGSQSNMVKTKNLKKSKVSNPSKATTGPKPDPKVLLNPQPLPPSEGGPDK